MFLALSGGFAGFFLGLKINSICPLISRLRLVSMINYYGKAEDESHSVQQCSEIDSALQLLGMLRNGEHEEVLARLPELLCRKVLKVLENASACAEDAMKKCDS